MTTVHHQERPDVVDVVAACRLLPVLVLPDAKVAAALGAALVEGGLRCAEVTLRTDGAVAAIEAMARQSDLLVGAGTVLTAPQVDQVVDAGARFVVSPGFSLPVVRRCQELGVPVFPGATTPTEIQMALDAGLDIVKFFPAELAGGVAMLKALAAPFPMVRFIPTGGVTQANLASYLALPSVLAVGGTWMVPAELLAAGDWTAIVQITNEATAKTAMLSG